MKYIFVFLFFSIQYVSTQNKQILYGFDEIPQSVLLNPSTNLDNRFFVGMPLLSHIHANVGSSGVNAFDLFADDNRDFNSRLRDVIYSLDNRDFVAVNQQLELFSGGFSYGRGLVKTNYLSFGMYQETDIIAYIPKDYAILMYEGNAGNIGRTFDLSDANFRGEVLSVFHVGSTKRINPKLEVGARFKIYSSIANMTSTSNSGRFLTVEGQNNIYNHIFDLDLSVQTSGIDSLIEDENSDITDDISTLRRRMFFGGNLGLGFDIGFTYKPTEQLTIDASLLDVGFIRHTKDVESYTVEGVYEFEGINPLFPEVSDGQTAEDYWNEVADEFEDLFEVDTTTTAYTTWRPVKLNAAVRYAFGKKNQGNDCNCLNDDVGYINEIGAQLFAIKRPRSPQFALTGYYYRRVFKALRAKLTYTVDSFSFTNVGLGISTHFGPVNFYLMADNLLEYRNLARANSASFQLGFNFVFDKKWK